MKKRFYDTSVSFEADESIFIYYLCFDCLLGTYVMYIFFGQYPGLHHANLIQRFLSGRYGEFKVDKRIIPQQSYSDFLRVNVMLADLNTWAIRTVGSYTFALKYFVGRARPEVRTKLINKMDTILQIRTHIFASGLYVLFCFVSFGMNQYLYLCNMNRK